ncbi:MAG TPA: TonB family protein, partial [Labilithrix sp.]
MLGLRRRVVAGIVAASLAASALAHAQPAPPQQHSLTTPKLLTSPEVPYPAGGSGEAIVTVEVVVGPDGSVLDAKALSENEPFSSAAVEAVKTWSFEPATRDGKPMAARIRVEIAFHPPEIKVEPPPPPPEPTPAKPPPTPKREEPVEVTVRGEKPEPSRTVTLTRTEVRQIPGTFGDPFRALEIMPGVTPIVTGLPFFFVRGAPPGNVGYFLDGVRVPLLFHVGVGPSVIHPALIDRVDLYPGGYPARFGRFAGGIVSGETVAPDPELHGEWNVRLFDAGAIAETGFDHGKGTILLGGRYSYT